MEHVDLIVKSVYITSYEVKFYVKNFSSIIKYMYLANNYNFYYLIITNETKNDIVNIKNNLNENKKNPEFNIEQLFFICSNNEQINWCTECNFNFELSDNINIEFNTYIPTKLNEPPSWAFDKHARFVNYYNDEKIKIIHLEGLEHNWKILHLLKNNIYVFISIPCYFHKWLCEFGANCIFTTNENYNKKNIIYLSPDLDCLFFAHEYGFNSILVNHNCFLNYDIFNIHNEEYMYDMVMNCRPELWKRPYLAENIKNLAYIKGEYYSNEKYDYTQLNCKYINEKRISPFQVNDIYNKSYCGGIFSEKEGACYSSSEYLLSGLPVISTYSRGGRDTWYNEQNSIIVEPTKENIENAVNECKKKINNGEFNRLNIRNEHIKMSNEMRNTFIKCTKYIFDLHNININEREHWNNKFFHKFINNVDISLVCDFLSDLK